MVGAMAASRTLHECFSSIRALLSASYVGWRTIGGCGRQLRYRATLMSMAQRASTKH